MGTRPVVDGPMDRGTARRKHKKRTKKRLMKAGRAFEAVVADIVREFDSTPHIETNVIVDGPDGHREIDVLIEGSVSGIGRKAFIECKDYNPERGPLGIAVVDALESKRWDLNYDLCALCSNAGFTADAVRKAARTGIALLGALKDGDERIRYRVLDEIFVLKIDVENVSASVTLDANFRPIDFDLMRLRFGGLKVQAWLDRPAPIVRRHVRCRAVALTDRRARYDVGVL